jgi:predicted nucleotidyltransferase
MKSLVEIRASLKSLKDRLRGDYPIRSLAIFGSYSRNEQSANSDLDLLVEFDENIGIRFIDLANELEKQLGIKIDLVSRKGIKEKYFQAIQSDLIYV